MALTFDANYYLSARPDVFTAFVKANGSTGLTWAQFAENHYNTFGRFEGSNPNSTFNTTEYLTANPDVAAAGVNPFQHFLSFGVNEGRAPSASFPTFASFDFATYLNANTDLAAAGITTKAQAWAHFVVYGEFENRPGAPAVNTGIAGTTYALTTSQDTFAGTANNDTFNAGVISDGGALKDSLQGVDSLDGGAGTDTLNATLNAGAVVVPVLKNIENVSLRVTAANSGIDLSASTGVNKLSIHDSTAATGANVLGSVAALEISNQNTDVTVDKSTATTLALSLNAAGVVSKTDAKVVTLDLGASAAAKATTLDVTANSSNVTVNSTKADVATTIKVAATGANTLTFTDSAATATTVSVTGTGSVDFTGANFAKVTSFTAADGGVKFISTNADAAALTVTTGAGADTITAVGASIKSLDVGGGNDAVTLNTSALSATSTVKLGAGDDSLTLSNAPAAGATIDGGAGSDTIALAKADYATISGYTDAQRALISNFEVLKITDKLANETIDVSKLTGVTSFVAGASVDGAKTANITNLGANASVGIEGDAIAPAAEKFTIDVTGTTAVGADTYTFNGTTITVADTDDAAAIAGKIAAGAYADWTTAVAGAVVTFTAKATGVQADVDNTKFVFKDVGGATTHSETFTTTQQGTDGAGTLNLSMKTDTSADVANLKLNVNYTENNDATSTKTALTHTVIANNIETLNVNSTGNASTAFLGATGNKADGVINTLKLTDSALVTLNVTGDHAFKFTSDAGQTKLATIDASANTAGATIDASAAASTSSALTIKGSATAANTLTGGAAADTITGGTAHDVITGGAKGDMLTGNGGHDFFVFGAGDSTIGTGNFDTINGFKANTLGNGANSVADKSGALTAGLTDATKLNGDIIEFAKSGDGSKGVIVGVVSNAADASTFLQNQHALNTAVVALDSSTGNLYIDNVGGDGSADAFIHITGLTTIDAAAFHLL